MNRLIVIITFLNLSFFLLSCGEKVQADGGWQLQYLFGYECITNGQAIWCN